MSDQVRYIGNKDAAGTSLGQSATDLVSFHGAAPVIQMTLVTNTSGSLGDTNTALNAVLTALKLKGLMSST